MMSRGFLWFNAVVIGAIGLAYLYDPNLLLRQYGLSVQDPGLDNMMRATYGGVFVGVAVIFGIGAVHPSRQKDALMLAALFFGGLALGRVASMIDVGLPPSGLLPLLGYEVIAAGLALVLGRRAVA